MNILKPLLGMLFLSAIIGVIISVVNAIRDQQWYKNVQRRNPLKKPYGLGWLMAFAKSPIKPVMEEQRFDEIILFLGEEGARFRAYKELGTLWCESIEHQGFDKEKGLYLYVECFHTGKCSKRYYFDRDMSFIVKRKNPIR